MAVSNPRHPHHCVIYRIENESPFEEDGYKRIIYSGVCRKDGSTNLRTFSTNNVIKSDYSLSLPGTVAGIMAGDQLDVTDRQGTFENCQITDAYAGNLGTTVYFNLAKT